MCNWKPREMVKIHIIGITATGMGPVMVRAQMVWSTGAVIYEPDQQKLQGCAWQKRLWSANTRDYVHKFLSVPKLGSTRVETEAQDAVKAFSENEIIESQTHKIVRLVKTWRSESPAFDPAPPPCSPLSHILKWHIHTFFSNSRDDDSIKSVTISYIATTLCCQFLWQIE